MDSSAIGRKGRPSKHRRPWRKDVAQNGEDPFDDTPTWELTKSQLDKISGATTPSQQGWCTARSRSSPASWRPCTADSCSSTNGKRPSTSWSAAASAAAMSADSPSAAPSSSSRRRVSTSGCLRSRIIPTRRPARRPRAGAVLDAGWPRRHYRRRHRRHQYARRHRPAQDEEGGYHQAGHLEIVPLAPQR